MIFQVTKSLGRGRHQVFYYHVKPHEIEHAVVIFGWQILNDTSLPQEQKCVYSTYEDRTVMAEITADEYELGPFDADVAAWCHDHEIGPAFLQTAQDLRDLRLAAREVLYSWSGSGRKDALECLEVVLSAQGEGLDDCACCHAELDAETLPQTCAECGAHVCGGCLVETKTGDICQACYQTRARADARRKGQSNG